LLDRTREIAFLRLGIRLIAGSSSAAGLLVLIATGLFVTTIFLVPFVGFSALFIAIYVLVGLMAVWTLGHLLCLMSPLTTQTKVCILAIFLELVFMNRWLQQISSNLWIAQGVVLFALFFCSYLKFVWDLDVAIDISTGHRKVKTLMGLAGVVLAAGILYVPLGQVFGQTAAFWLTILPAFGGLIGFLAVYTFLMNRLKRLAFKTSDGEFDPAKLPTETGNQRDESEDWTQDSPSSVGD
jgi:hypothetical protein